MNFNIAQWLNTIVPMAHIVQAVNQVLPAFVFVAFMILLIGYQMGIASSETVFAPSLRLVFLGVSIAAAPWFLSLAQGIANALVGAIAGVVQGLNWLVVNNPTDSSLSLDFTKAFQVIGKYIVGAPGPRPEVSLMEVNKWPDYLMRVIFIFLTGLIACVTVFIMEAMLIIQKLILVFGKMLVPIFIACLSLPAAHGSAQNFLKNILGVMCWPVGWAIVHVGTMAALQALQPPSWNAQLGELVLACATLAVVCFWPIVGTILAPMLIAKTVTSGTNFAHGMVGGFASVAGQHAARGLQSVGAVTGALAGAAMSGPAGAAAGAALGSTAGRGLAMPVTSATESAEGVNEGRRPIPSSRSAAAADAAIGLIKARS
jgi:hypothetical protein